MPIRRGDIASQKASSRPFETFYVPPLLDACDAAFCELRPPESAMAAAIFVNARLVGEAAAKLMQKTF